MKIAFYAPMKSPGGGQPSGDRTIGRLLTTALQGANFDVRLASELRSWSPSPDAERLADCEHAGANEAAKLVEQFNSSTDRWRPDVWLTYHVYYKAPDFVGPKVAAALGIPYAIVEASFAPRRAHDTWSGWLAAARSGIEVADGILSFTARDRLGLSEICAPERLFDLAPFVDLDRFVGQPKQAASGPNGPSRLIAVAMMRTGAKQLSYELLARALALLAERDWHLDIVGGGSASSGVEAAFSVFPPERVTFHGQLDACSVHTLMQGADIFVWPGIDEAFGMAYLEAQASGLPVVALRTAGVPEVVRHGETGLLAAALTPAAFAACLEQLLDDDALRLELGAGARDAVEKHHSIDAASVRLGGVLRGLISRKQLENNISRDCRTL